MSTFRRLFPNLSSKVSQRFFPPRQNYPSPYSPRLTLKILSVTARFILFAHVFWAHAYCVSATWGASMLPTLSVVGDYCLTSMWYRRGRGIEVGDIVVFDSVVKPGETVIKRIIGLEGDYVLRDTPLPGGEGPGKMLQVPRGHCWVVGDNLPFSRDSRHFGPMPMGLIRGKVIAKMFPWSERRWIGNGLNRVVEDTSSS